MALQPSALQRSIRSLIFFPVLVAVQVLVALTMTVVANRFNVRCLGDVTILLWIGLVVLFWFGSACGVILRLCLSLFSFILALCIYSVLLYIYKTQLL